MNRSRSHDPQRGSFYGSGTRLSVAGMTVEKVLEVIPEPNDAILQAIAGLCEQSLITLR
ncbi:MAG: hypothetical protein VCB43_12830 [Myxococcota bacterium]